MDPVKLPDSNLTLTQPGAGGRGDIPAVAGEDPRGKSVVRTAWRPDDGERKALVNGALVMLDVRTPPTGHPPVGLGVGEPDMEQAEPLLTQGNVMRALGLVYGRLLDAQHIIDSGPHDVTDWPTVDPLGPEDLLELFEAALVETREPPAPPAEENGAGT